MTRRARAFLAGGMLLVGVAAPAWAERFTNMRYLGGGSADLRRQSGALVLEGGATLRWRGPREQLCGIAAAINRMAREGAATEGE